MVIDLTPDEVEVLVRALDLFSSRAAARGYAPVQDQAEELSEKVRRQAWEQRRQAGPTAPAQGGG